MRQNLNWDGYVDAERILSMLNVPIGKEIIRLLASNKYGMTQAQIIDNCRYGADMVRDWLADLTREGFLVQDMAQRRAYPIVHEVGRYQINWKQIRQINKAISRMP